MGWVVIKHSIRALGGTSRVWSGLVRHAVQRSVPVGLRRLRGLAGGSIGVAAGFTALLFVLSPGAADRTGVRRQVFPDVGFNGTPLLDDVGTTIALDFLNDDPDLPKRFFSARWTGYWYAREAGDVELHGAGDDRLDVWLDGELVIRRTPPDDDMHTLIRTVRLDAGAHELRVEYEQHGGAFNMRLEWAPPGGRARPLPAYRLFRERPNLDDVHLAYGVAWLQPAVVTLWIVIILGIILAWLGTLAWQRVGLHSPYGHHLESAFRRCERFSEVRHEGSMAHDVHAVARLAFLVAAVAALGSLFSYELLRAIADRLAPAGNAANLDRTLHAAIVVYLRAIAVAAAIAAGSLLVGGQAVASRLATPRFRRAPTLVWTVVFVIVLLGVRLWYLDFEGWDESTFIIMGSHVLAGHLPYLELFDIKPPGIFFALAGVMYVFGENLLAVHFFGTFCLLVSAIAGYAIAIRQTTPLIAGASMAVFCALTCETEFQPTMTEHLTIALMMPACWLLVARRDQLWVAFLVGVLLSAATLTRMNIAFVVLAVGGFYVWRFVRPRPDVPRLAIAAYGVGGALPLALLLLAYWLADGLDVFVLSVFRVPFHYAFFQKGMAAVILGQAAYWMTCVREDPYIFLPATLFIGTGLATHAISRGKGLLVGDNGLLLLVLGAVSLSILKGGATFGHYLLQALPLVLLLAAAGFERLTTRRLGALLFLGLYVLTVGASLARFGGSSVERVRQGLAPSQRSRLRTAAELILEDRCCGELVYAPREHLIYWYLKQRPPSAVVHPSNVNRPAIMAPLVAHGYVPEDEQRRILERNIGYIVMDPDRKVGYLTPEQRRRLAGTLQDRFHPWKNSGGLVIYKRR